MAGMNDEPQQIAPYSVRMEPALRKALEDSAKENSRSLHAEMILRLSQSVGTQKAEDKPLTERKVREIVQDEFNKLKYGDIDELLK